MRDVHSARNGPIATGSRTTLPVALTLLHDVTRDPVACGSGITMHSMSSADLCAEKCHPLKGAWRNDLCPQRHAAAAVLRR